MLENQRSEPAFRFYKTSKYFALCSLGWEIQKLVSDLKWDLESKNASVVPMSIGWAIQLYFIFVFLEINLSTVVGIKKRKSKYYNLLHYKTSLSHIYVNISKLSRLSRMKAIHLRSANPTMTRRFCSSVKSALWSIRFKQTNAAGLSGC